MYDNLDRDPTKADFALLDVVVRIREIVHEYAERWTANAADQFYEDGTPYKPYIEVFRRETLDSPSPHAPQTDAGLLLEFHRAPHMVYTPWGGMRLWGGCHYQGDVTPCWEPLLESFEATQVKLKYDSRIFELHKCEGVELPKPTLQPFSGWPVHEITRKFYKKLIDGSKHREAFSRFGLDDIS